jgi:hypothetical protein
VSPVRLGEVNSKKEEIIVSTILFPGFFFPFTQLYVLSIVGEAEYDTDDGEYDVRVNESAEPDLISILPL